MSTTKTGKLLAYIKIISGEYVIGEVRHEDENVITLKKPLSTKFEPTLGGLQIFPYDALYLGKELDEVTFKKEQLLHIHENEDVPSEIAAKYTEYATGIVSTAPANNTGIIS